MSLALVKISGINNRLVPLGLACLQAYMNENDVKVKVFNFRGMDYDLPKVMVDPLVYLTLLDFIINHSDLPLTIPIVDTIRNGAELDFNKGIFPDIIKDYSSRLFETPEITQQRLESITKFAKKNVGKLSGKYSKIGFAVDYLNLFETAILSTFIKTDYPDTKIVWGGPAISQSAEGYKFLLKRNACDGLVVGEGEQPLLDFALGKDLSEVKGVMSFKNSDSREFIYTRGAQLDLDTLPTPDFTDIPLETYFDLASVYRSRGCTGRCKFCGEWFLFGPKFRVRSVENVVNDIETIIKKHNPGYMMFGESLINDDLKYFEDLCDAMIERDFGMNFGTHFRANLTSELAKKAFKAGFNDAWIGFEAFTNTELDKMNKGVNINQNLNTIKILTENGINVLAMLVVGFSNIEDELENCKAVLRNIEEISKGRYIDTEGKERPLKIQFRPAAVFLIPGSFDYKDIKSDRIRFWKPKFASPSIKKEIGALESELSILPYEFKRSIPNNKVSEIIKKIQDADRDAGFSVGGIMEYALNYVRNMRKKDRKRRKIQKMGVAAQRFKNG